MTRDPRLLFGLAFGAWINIWPGAAGYSEISFALAYVLVAFALYRSDPFERDQTKAVRAVINKYQNWGKDMADIEEIEHALSSKQSIPTQSQRCWFFHRWSAYDLPSLVTIANEGVLTQRRVCTRCHAVDHRYVQAHN